MTREAALVEALRRWGPGSRADSDLEELGVPGGLVLVGRGVDGLFRVMGRGSSWEAAFEDADRRAKS